MTPNQQKFYVLGLQDAIKEIQMEAKGSELVMQSEAGRAYQYTCRICVGAIKELIEATSKNL
jgi:predicted methyltransferase